MQRAVFGVTLAPQPVATLPLSPKLKPGWSASLSFVPTMLFGLVVLGAGIAARFATFWN